MYILSYDAMTTCRINIYPSTTLKRFRPIANQCKQENNIVSTYIKGCFNLQRNTHPYSYINSYMYVVFFNREDNLKVYSNSDIKSFYRLHIHVKERCYGS